MDSYGDVIGVLMVVLMIRAGWSLARAAWDEPSRPRSCPEPVLDLRSQAPRDAG